MLTVAEFAQLLTATGEPVTWRQNEAPQATANVRAIVASTSKAPEAIINAYGVNGISFQVAAISFPVAPVKFDEFETTSGGRFVVDNVVEHRARTSGAVVSYTCYCKGS